LFLSLGWAATSHSRAPFNLSANHAVILSEAHFSGVEEPAFVFGRPSALKVQVNLADEQ
jgi:hypothetical protein